MPYLNMMYMYVCDCLEDVVQKLRSVVFIEFLRISFSFYQCKNIVMQGRECYFATCKNSVYVHHDCCHFGSQNVKNV